MRWRVSRFNIGSIPDVSNIPFLKCKMNIGGTNLTTSASTANIVLDLGLKWGDKECERGELWTYVGMG